MNEYLCVVALLFVQTAFNVQGNASSPREVVNFDFAWKFHLGNPNPAQVCPPNSFPKNLSLVEYLGLQKNQASTAELCMNACCLDPSCAIWQFDSNCTDQSCDCWMGQSSSCINNSKWIGGGRIVPAVSVGPASSGFNDSGWELVDAPHDPIVAGTYTKDGPASHAYLPQNVTWYRKHFSLPVDWKGRSIWLYFEGIFHASTVFLNGKELLFHDSGYTSFSVRLDNASSVFYGDGAANENVLAVYATAEGGSGWWYEGGGIYRHTYLVSAGPVHFAADSLYGATNVTGDISANDQSDPTKGMMVDKATLNPIAEVVNDSPKAAKFTVMFSLFDETGVHVAAGSTESMANPNQTVQVHLEMPVSKIQLWTAARTYLYTLQFDVTSDVTGSNPADSVNVTIGFRHTRWDSDTGFYLNDLSFKWRGFCDHNDFTGVGVAIPDRVNLFRAQMVKAVGGNAWRMSHNPPTPPLLDILDRLGIVVWDENRNFGNKSQWILNQRDMVRRDRNHPSVMVWSFCNEGGCAPAKGPALTAIGNVFKEASKEQDMYRPVTANVIQGIDQTYSLSDAIDVTGYSHQNGKVFDNFHQKYPKRPTIASECCSCTTQRGEDVRNKTKPSLGNFNGDCDESQTGVQFDRNFVSGTLVWTLFDYYGEPSDYHWPQVSSAFGSIDLAGFAKASAFWYRTWWLYDPTNTNKSSDSVWFPPPLPNPSSDSMAAQQEDHDGHLVHIVQSWEPRADADKRTIQVYSNAPTVTLYVNGASQGAQNTTYRKWTEWQNVAYAPGNLTAVAMSSSGGEVARHTVETSGEAASIRLDVDVPSKVTGTGTALLLDGQDAGLIRATILDAKGRVVRSASHNVTFRVVSGPGRIIGVGNGDPMCHEPNTVPWRSAFHGLARAIVQVTEHGSGSRSHRKRLAEIDRDGGKRTRILGVEGWAEPAAESIVVEATAEGLSSANVTIPVSTDPADGVLSVAAKWMLG
eukprot:m.7665 g.7665  ORF g.7665 m.7665 type:complete len:973 (+) comp19344_c0_seq1:163-3081(+)